MTKPVVVVLSILAAVLGAVAGVSLWADLTLVDGNTFSRSAAAGLASPRASAAAGQLAAESAVGDSSVLKPLRTPLSDAVAATLRRPSSRPVLEETARSAHSVVIDGRRGPVQVNLTTVYEAVRHEVGTSDPEVADLMPDLGDLGNVTLIDAGELPDLSEPAGVVSWTWPVAFFVAAAILAAAIWFAQSRRFAVTAASLAVAMAGLATWGLIETGPNGVAAAVSEQGGRTVTQAIVDELTPRADTIALAVFAAGGVAAALSLLWPRRRRTPPQAPVNAPWSGM